METTWSTAKLWARLAWGMGFRLTPHACLLSSSLFLVEFEGLHTAMQSFWGEIVRIISEHPAAQAVGFVALCVTVMSYQARTTRGIAFRQAVGSLFWTAHLILLGAWTGGLLNLLGMARSAVYSQRGVRPWASRACWPWVFGALCVGAAAWAGLAQGEGPRLLLSAAAQCLACHSLWITRVRRSRALLLAGSFLWLAYDALSGSIPGTLCELFSEVSICVAMARDRRAPAP